MKPERVHRYENALMDSARWDRINVRDDDIIISTPYKAGTTWTQRICSLLLFDSIELEKPITAISPWVDAKFAPIDEIAAVYEQQSHRRFIKTHTALSGIPYYDKPLYLVCGRDPRDVFLSMENHYSNLNMETMNQLIGGGSGPVNPTAGLPDDVNERFKLWLTRGSFDWESDGYPFWSALYHLQSFWAYRHLENIHFIHYNDLKRDLEGQMRRLAGLFGVSIPEKRWPDLVDAATFSTMKKDYKKTAPSAQKGLWRDPAKFFNRGTSGQWRDVLSADSLALYESVKRERLDSSLADWIDSGSLGL